MSNKSRKKRCSGCTYWIKLKNDTLGGGLCQLQDGRASSDFSCDRWAGKPYKRDKFDNNKLIIV